MAHPMPYCWVDGVLCNIATHSEVVIVSLLLTQSATKPLHLVSGLPGTGHYFTNTTHGLVDQKQPSVNVKQVYDLSHKRRSNIAHVLGGLQIGESYYKFYPVIHHHLINLYCDLVDLNGKLDWANSAPTYPQTGHHSRHRF